MATISVLRKSSHTLLDAETALDTVSDVLLNEGHDREISGYVIGNGAVSAGAVQFETAHDPAYTGTWAPLDGAITVLADAQTFFQLTGHFRAFRVRISTAVVGGTVTVVADVVNHLPD